MNKAGYLISSSGKKKAIVIPIKTYKRLLEDLHDLSVIVERKDEPAISFEELKKQQYNRQRKSLHRNL